MIRPNGTQYNRMVEPSNALRPLLFVVSGPSGSGKGTALHHLCETFPELKRVTTYTTRAPRPNEQPDVDYRYVSEEEFARLQASGEIYESARTYRDYAYGSPACLVAADDARPLLVELEIKGMLRLKACSLRRVVSIFVMPSSIEHLSDRVRNRHEEGNFDQRMEVATEQARYALAYDYVLVNDDLDRFTDDLEAVVRAELLRTDGQARALDADFRHS